MLLKEETKRKLKTSLAAILDEYADKGIKNNAALEDVKTAISALEKLSCLCSMEQDTEEDTGGYQNSYDSADRAYSERYHDAGEGYSRTSLRNKLQGMRLNVSAHERSLIDKLLGQL